MVENNCVNTLISNENIFFQSHLIHRPESISLSTPAKNTQHQACPDGLAQNAPFLGHAEIALDNSLFFSFKENAKNKIIKKNLYFLDQRYSEFMPWKNSKLFSLDLIRHAVTQPAITTPLKNELCIF